MSGMLTGRYLEIKSFITRFLCGGKVKHKEGGSLQAEAKQVVNAIERRRIPSSPRVLKQFPQETPTIPK
jgi:hypothetical protein